MLFDVKKVCSGKTFQVGMTNHALRRYRKRVKNISKSAAKRQLRQILEKTPLSAPARGDKQYIRFSKGFVVLSASATGTRWIVVTVLKLNHYVEDNAKVTIYEEGNSNVKNQKREGSCVQKIKYVPRRRKPWAREPQNPRPGEGS